MTKALITIENQNPSDWDLIRGDDSELLKFLATAGLELHNINTESIKAFSDEGSMARGIMFETGQLPIISFSRLAAVSVEHPNIISTTITFTEPTVIQGRAKREEKSVMRTGAARVRISTPPY
ncbi:hypothetical protein HZB78_03240 [Candidatus Collierbacteria bacterium]|nr:hypothetical protein [Candidatus Collierbacteria bacterium]